MRRVVKAIYTCTSNTQLRGRGGSGWCPDALVLHEAAVSSARRRPGREQPRWYQEEHSWVVVPRQSGHHSSERRRGGELRRGQLLTPTRMASGGIESVQRMGVEGGQGIEVRSAEGGGRRRDVQLERGRAVIHVVVVVDTDRPGVVSPGTSWRTREAGRPSRARAVGVVGVAGVV